MRAVFWDLDDTALDILTGRVEALAGAYAAFTMDVYGHLLSGQQSAAAAALDHLIGE